MRHPALVVLLALAALAAPLHAADTKKKAGPADVGDGRAAWFDLTTSDLAKSKEFYGKLFDWKFEALEGTEYAVEIVSDGTPIGTLRVAEGAISGFNGVVYVQVADVRKSCDRARELGATLIPGFPFNLTNRDGAIGLITDPVGHPLGMYSRSELKEK
jgi:predicted enzyme related to lactoylglutathione lyase